MKRGVSATHRKHADSAASSVNRAQESSLLLRPGASRLRTWSVNSELHRMGVCLDCDSIVQPTASWKHGESESVAGYGGGSGARILGSVDPVVDSGSPRFQPAHADTQVYDMTWAAGSYGCGNIGIVSGRLFQSGQICDDCEDGTTPASRYKPHSSRRSFNGASYSTNCETIRACSIPSGVDWVATRQEGHGSALGTEERLELSTAETGFGEAHVTDTLGQIEDGAKVTPVVSKFTAGVDLYRERKQKVDRAARGADMRQPAFITNPPAVSRRSFQKLVTKQFDLNKELSPSAIRLSMSYKGYMLEDVTGELGLHRLPHYSGCVRTCSVLWSRWAPHKHWNSRYFVLYRGHWFVFKSQGDYEEHGLDGCMASLSLVMNRFQIDLDPKRTTRFALTVGDWFCLLVDTGIEQQDRGAWVIHFLAYQNKGEIIREWFRRLDWDELQNRSRLVARESGWQRLF